jgi:hypothetical protein
MGAAPPNSRGGSPQPMSSSRRFAFLLAFGLAAVSVALAQSSSSSSSSAADTPDQYQAGQPATSSDGMLSVQARIRARREQRRATAIHQVYDHRYEIFAGMGYLRFTPGSTLQRAHEYAWNAGATHYFDERFGVTVAARGYHATAYVGNNELTNSAITNPAISEHAVLAGPTYRFYVEPKYSISGRVMGGFIHGNFSGDTYHSTVTSTKLGLWKDGNTYAASVAIPVEYNLTPRIGLRVAPEYFLTGFGSTQQNSLGFTTDLIYRFGRQ